MSLPEIAVMCYFQNIFTVGSDASCFWMLSLHSLPYYHFCLPCANVKGISKVSIATANGAQRGKPRTTPALVHNLC